MNFLKMYLLLCLLLPLQALAKLQNYDPIITVVLMVKNEESVIVETIEPFVKGGITSFLIYDTGSTDNTIARVQNYFASDSKLTGIIVEEPFIDFAPSRNRALDLAQEYFPDAAFFVMPDAEWYIENADQLLEFCKERIKENDPTELYGIHIGNEYIDFVTARLFKADTTIRFVESPRRHESPSEPFTQKAPSSIYFKWIVTDYGHEKSRERWKEDAKLLLTDYQEDPTNSRTIFYLAQTYELLGNYEQALHFYRLRTDMPQFHEERYMAMYRVAQIIETLCNRDQATWSEALEAYLKAYEFRPNRIEPLVRIARHYIQEDQHHLAFIFAREACETPYPENDLLFVDKHLYDFDRWEILSWAAWYTQDWKIGEWAAEKAFAARPNLPHVRRNLGLYLQQQNNLI